MLREHYASIHPLPFKSQPLLEEMGKLTNDFKKIGHSTLNSIEDIFNAATNGQSMIISNFEIRPNEKGIYDFQFVSSSLIFIDIDDDACTTSPLDVLDNENYRCTGLFYTFSHGIKGNRYRLVYQLDKPITDLDLYKNVVLELSLSLQEKGLPVDISGATKNPTSVIRTGVHGKLINNYVTVLETDPLIELAHKRILNERKEKAEKLISLANRKSTIIYSYEELQERANAIGYLAERDTWIKLGMALKSYVNEGHISDAEGYEVFSILSDENSNYNMNVWNTFNPRSVGIGSFIAASNEAGFKRSFRFYHAVSPKDVALSNIENVYFDKYIDSNYAKEILERERAILVKAPTGSGKPSSFIEASKALPQSKEKPSRYFIFAVPTIAITEQTSNDKDILGITGTTTNVFKKLAQYSNKGNRVIVTTYDMAHIIIDQLKRINNFASFSLIIDEYHQLVHSYNYRTEAITNLYGLKNKVKSFIGLSGTIEDILKNDFNYEIHINTKNMDAPCRLWTAITYDNRNEEEASVLFFITELMRKKRKLLLFIQNIEMINRLKKKLQDKGIKVRTITSESKKYNPTYKTIVEDSSFPDDVEVILTTTVLSDGININNVLKDKYGNPILNSDGKPMGDLSFDCAVLCSQQSKIFNLSIIRQMTNRFRYEYGVFYVITQTAKRNTDYLFNIDQAYNYDTFLAENAKHLLATEFKDNFSQDLFRASYIEKRFGIYFENNIPKYDPLKIRYNTAKEKNDFYSLYRNQFIKALSIIIGKEPYLGDHIISNINELLEDMNLNLDDDINEIAAAKEIAKGENQLRSLNIESKLTFEVYNALLEQNEPIINSFKSMVSKEQYTAASHLCHLAPYETVLKLTAQVKRPADIYSVQKRFTAFLDTFYFEQVHRQTPSREVYMFFKNHLDITYKKDELNEILTNLQKKYKRAKTVDVKNIYNNYFLHETFRKKEDFERSTYVTLRPISIEFLQSHYKLSYKEVIGILEVLIQQLPKVQKVVLEKIFETQILKQAAII